MAMRVSTASISGVDKLKKKVEKISEAARKEILDAIKKGVVNIHSTAIQGIAQRSMGRKYKSRRAKGKIHIASKPGDPFNTDTSATVQSIKWELDRTTLEGRVGSNYKIAKYLEKARDPKRRRPWLRPAYEKNRKQIEKRVKLALERGLKK